MFITKVSQLKHGMKVKCEIEGEKIEDARIGINENGDVYICQNQKHRGAMHTDNFGYEYSWMIALQGISRLDYTVQNLRTAEKTSLSELEAGDIVIDKYGDKYKILAVAGEACLLSYRNGFDGASYWCTFKELEKEGYKVLQEEAQEEEPQEEETLELTLQEIAEKFGVPTVKIKE